MRWFLLICMFVVMTGQWGCQSPERRKEQDRNFEGPDKASELASREKNRSTNSDSPAHWLDKKQPDWMRGSTPDALSWNKPGDAGYDYKSETSGLLAGYLENPEGRKVGNVFIEVREVGDTKTVPVGIHSDANGTFMTQGLKPNKNYVLTVHTKDGSRNLFQTVYTRTPNANVRISLLETDAAPARVEPTTTGPGTTAPPEKTTSPSALPSEDPLKRAPTNSLPSTPTDGPLPTPSFNMGGRLRERDTGVAPVGGYEAIPPSRGRRADDRYDLTTDQGPLPWRAPAAEIPNTRTAIPIPSAEPFTRNEVRKVTKNENTFTLVDHTGRDCNLPATRLVVLSFLTTGSVSSQRVVADLNVLHERYRQQDIGFASLICDDEPLQTRVMAADMFRRKYQLAGELVTESSMRPGSLQAKFGMTEFPTTVLLNANGAVLWQGHPSMISEIQTILDEALRIQR